MLAYEPVWAIGTGQNATPEQAQSGPPLDSRTSGALGRPRRRRDDDPVRRQRQAGECGVALSQPDVDGALVGGASLKADQFLAIVSAA